MTKHPYWIGRKLTQPEWDDLKQRRVTECFHTGDPLPDGTFFLDYGRNYRDGICRGTAERLAARRQEAKTYFKANRNLVNQRSRQWQNANRERMRAMCRDWHRRNGRVRHERRIKNPRYIVATRLRRRVQEAYQRYAITKRTRHAQPDSLAFLLWQANRLGIVANCKTHEIDHLIPLSRIDLACPSIQRIANSPINLRWLPHSDNSSKKDKQPSMSEVEDHLRLYAAFVSSLPL